jgi:hypothetical protein
MAEGKLERELEALVEQKTSFGLCLSAMISIFGEANNDGTYEYVLRANDFHRISEADLNIENAMFDNEPGTKVTVKTKPQNGV